MENTKELILVYQEMRSIHTMPSKAINIMLSPQFYTLIREELPVKYAYQAKRIAASLFDGLLEDADEHHYFVIKEEDSWLFIAYNPAMIRTFLESKGIDVETISKIYFAEQSLDAFVSPVRLGEVDALVNLNGTMTVVPQILLESDKRTMTINRSFTPKKGVSFEARGDTLLNTNDTYTLAAILLLFTSIYVIEASRYGNGSAIQEEEMQVILKNYPALESSYTRNSILSKYRKIDKEERIKRDVIKSLSSMIFKGATLTRLSINDTKFQASFNCSDATVSKRLKALAKKENFVAVGLKNSNNISIEGRL
jgi:hypothetical protein